MREYVKDGTVNAFALWNPEDLGYLAAYAAEALVNGDINGEEGDTFKAGKLGEFTVGADGTVLLGDPFVFDATTSTTSTSESSLRPGRRSDSAEHPRTRRHREETDATRLLPAPGQARTGSRSTSAGTRRSGPRCSQALAATGWHNYSLFLRRRRPADRLLRDARPSTTPSPGMAATEVNARWQAEMAEFFGPRRRARPTPASSGSRRSSTSRTSSTASPDTDTTDDERHLR